MSDDVRTLTARWVFPASSPPLEGGTVTVRGDTIEAVEPRGVRTADEDLGNVALIPGLVNAHTHLDLSGARGLIPPTDPDHFTDWLKGVIAYRRTRSEEQTLADIESGLAECLRFGTTLIGDIASEGKSWDLLSRAATRSVVFWELLGLSEQRAQSALANHAAWVGSTAETADCRRGVSPHAPYSTCGTLLRAGSRADSLRPTATHLAESVAEIELLHHRRGPFVDFLNTLGLYLPDRLANSFGEVTAACDFGQPKLFIHANYLTASDYLSADCSIVYCPRTHAAFGHSPHPFRDFLARGVRVCLGTDSLASNPDLDILAETRFVYAKYPDFSGDQLLKMVTLSGAEALGWADECGSLEPGKSADLVAVPLPDVEGEPHELLFGPAVPGEARRTLWRGEWR